MKENYHSTNSFKQLKIPLNIVLLLSLLIRCKCNLLLTKKIGPYPLNYDSYWSFNMRIQDLQTFAVTYLHPW